MTSTLEAVCLDALDPPRLAAFWSGLLGWSVAPPIDRHEPVAIDLLPDDDTGFNMRFVATDVPKSGLHRQHPDLTSTPQRPQAATVARALDLGARPLDVGQRPEEGHTVLADPEGNEFCVLPEGNRFLADCGFLGALAGDGTRAVGLFWSTALGWPLVWDEGEETAIRSPAGGPKLTWGGPPVPPLTGRPRVRWALRCEEPADVDGEVERLVGLGAVLLGRDDGVRLADPDGNEFSLR